MGAISGKSLNQHRRHTAGDGRAGDKINTGKAYCESIYANEENFASIKAIWDRATNEERA